MSKIEKAKTAAVAYPAKERAFAFSGDENTPMERVLIGVTYPLSEYEIFRGPDVGIFDFEYVAEGRGEIFLDGEWREANAGDTYILVPDRVHHYRADAQKPWKKFWVNFRCDYMGAMLKAYGIKQGCYPVDTRAYFDALLSLAGAGRSYGEICFTVADCIHQIASCVGGYLQRGQNSDAFVVREALNAAVYRKIGLEDIARQLHMSKSNMIRVFRRAYGITPYEYLLASKTDAAKLLLRNTRMTVKEIADYVHITDEHYFSTLFLRRTGQRPSDYRQSAE